MSERRSSVNECTIVELPRVLDPRGNLTAIEGRKHIPYEIQRIFYLYDVPGGATRAGHALRSCYQFCIAMSGSCDFVLDDGMVRKRVHLNRSYYGLMIPPLIWREIDNFSSGCVCLVLASEPYDEQGYYREHAAFVRAVRPEVA